MSTDLRGRVALVTGAARGMGAAHARRLSAAGATVAPSATSLRTVSGVAATRFSPAAVSAGMPIFIRKPLS